MHQITLTEPTVVTPAMRYMVRTEVGDFIWFPLARPCWQCGELCSWMELNFETWLHPGRQSTTPTGVESDGGGTVLEGCDLAAWQEYWAATPR